MELGIVGLSKSGKTTVFNALTRLRADTTLLAQPSGKANLGVVKVPDPRVDTLAKMFQDSPTVYAEVRYVDIPGAPEGLGKSTGIGGEYLNALQRADALVHVIRAFENPSVAHAEVSIDPYRDIATMDLELAFSDITLLDRRMERLQTDFKGAKPHERERILQETALLERLKAALADDVPVRNQSLSAEEQRTLSTFQLLTAKPLLQVLNIGEGQLPKASDLEKELAQRLARPGVLGASICAKLEAELAQMPQEEEAEFRRSLEAGEPGASKVVRLSYRLLSLVSFLTVGEDEIRAWTVTQGTPAAKAAGRVHSDIERGFIRAEVVAYDDLMACGSMAEARRKGVLRTEGRTYPVKDGDVITFLFNV